MTSKFKTINALMAHLRANGIAIAGSYQKRQLINTGYFHGYKGYRFFKESSSRLPFQTYKELLATIRYDSQLKALFYDKIMFIETAIKQVALQTIIEFCRSTSINDMYETAVSSYKNTSTSSAEKKKKQVQKQQLTLQSHIQHCLLNAYNKDNPQISHYYNKKNFTGIPLWALFEILSMGDFGQLLSVLVFDVRDALSKGLGLNTAVDTRRELCYKYIYALKDLRNAVAHNYVVFDARFRTSDASLAMKRCLEFDIRTQYVNFKTIDDYVLLIVYFLKRLKEAKTVMKQFIASFEKITQEYCSAVDASVSGIVIHPNRTAKMKSLKSFI